MKKVIITVISFILLLIIFDVIVFHIDNYNFNKRIAKIDNGLQNIKKSYRLGTSSQKYSLILDDFDINHILQTSFRAPILKGKNSDNIFIFGCSFAYGSPLEADENFSAYLAEDTKYSVYNYAYGGWGIQHFLALLENYDFSSIKSPKYVIYIYMSDHIRRMYSKYYEFFNTCYFRYLYKNNKLYVDKLNLPTLYIYRKLNMQYIKYLSNSEKYKTKNFFLFSKYIEKINTLIQQKFPGSKFIILVYDDQMNYDWSQIEKMGISVIKKEEFLPANEKERLPDGHPTSETWKHCAELFVKEAKLND